MKIVPVEVSQYLAVLAKGEYDLALFSWIPGSFDPHLFFMPLFAPSRSNRPITNFSFWDYPELAVKLQEAQYIAHSTEARSRHYRMMYMLIVEEVPWIPLFHPIIRIAARKEVHGLTLLPTGRELFDRVWISR